MSSSSLPRIPPTAAIWIVILLVTIVTIARLASTYRIFNATSDEPAHISSGMEWLQFGTYTYEPQHPPLARIAVALGPYLKGLRSKVKRTPATEAPAIIFDEGYEILYSDGDYWRNLTLARLGNIPFLLILGWVTYAWGHRYFNEWVGLLGLILLFSLPPILGQAGLATLDLACVATVTLALYRFLRWLETPSLRSAILMGAASAIAVLTKFSAIPFLLICYVPAFLILHGRHNATPTRRYASTAVVSLGVSLVVFWAGYRFSILPLDPQYGPHPGIDRLLQNRPFLAPLMNGALHLPIPLTEFILGVRDLWRHNSLGHDSYLFGEFRRDGWWYFFPVVVALKTPIGFLVLAIVGVAFALKHWRRENIAQALTALFPMCILLFCMTSHIDAGVRHILSIFPPLALVASHAAVSAWRVSRGMAIVAVLLVVVALAESVHAHPDYIASFNALAGSHPENILAESDLDLGQDLDRLSQRLRELNADHVSVGYFGSAPLNKAGLPPYRTLGLQDAIPGYVAVSLRYLNLEYAKNGGYGWLRAYKPVERIGKSIDLYYLPTIP